tara:strand:- start:382 stop:1095 length:714 start_codon:yes stop_codon:yes gene_type:complete
MINDYSGKTAKEYLSKRINHKMWLSEQNEIEKIVSTIPNGSSVLDVPFGTGRFAKLYLNNGLKVFGIDISKDMLNEAKSLLKDDYEKCNIAVGSAENLTFEDSSIDYIICCRLLNLVPANNVHNIINELVRVADKKIIIGIRIKDMSIINIILRTIKIIFFDFRSFLLGFYKIYKRLLIKDVKNNEQALFLDFSYKNLLKVIDQNNLSLSSIVEVDCGKFQRILYPLKFFIIKKKNI